MNELTPYVVKDTGAQLLIKKVSPLLIMELRRQFPEPEIPTQTVDIGGETKIERNYADPDYERALKVYGFEQEARIRRLLISRGVVIPEDNTTWQTEIAEMRNTWLADFGKELPKLGNTDEIDWICYCALGTEADYEDLYIRILQRSQPTTEAVETAKAGFPG
jgi:hypothetical protein